MSAHFNKLTTAAAKEGLDLVRMTTGGLSPGGRLVGRTTYSVTRMSDRRLLCSGFPRPDSALKFARDLLAKETAP